MLGHGANTVVRRMERKCANTVGTVLVPWAGHFPTLKYEYIFFRSNMRKQFYQTALGNLWFEMLHIIIFVTLSFPMFSDDCHGFLSLNYATC